METLWRLEMMVFWAEYKCFVVCVAPRRLQYKNYLNNGFHFKKLNYVVLNPPSIFILSSTVNLSFNMKFKRNYKYWL